MFKWVAATVSIVIAILALATYTALELSDVLTVTTVNHENGEPRQTHVWFVEDNGAVKLEAGNPKNPWVLDIAKEPNVAIAGNITQGNYKLSIEPAAQGHPRIRNLMRAKYGWRDKWVAMLFDVSGSQLVHTERQH